MLNLKYIFAQVHCTTVAYEDGRIDRPNSQLMPAYFGPSFLRHMPTSNSDRIPKSPPYHEFYPAPTDTSIGPVQLLCSRRLFFYFLHFPP